MKPHEVIDIAGQNGIIELDDIEEGKYMHGPMAERRGVLTTEHTSGIMPNWKKVMNDE